MKVKQPSELMRDNLIVKHYAGSISYGTNLPTSDVDFRGIFCADPINVRTPFYNVRECEDKSEEDTKLYELSHFMKLCLECNPNIIESLWVDESDIIETSSAYGILRSHREALLSKKIAFTFSGYALSQLKRIKGHNKWINNPQTEAAPKQTDHVSLVYNFSETKMFNRDFDITNFYRNHRLVPYGGNVFGLYEADSYSPYNRVTYNLNTEFEDDGSFHSMDDGSRRKPIAIVKFNKDEYNLAKDKWKQYWEWKENRNETRSALEEEFGYDTKHAMHLVRLLRMGKEVLETGQVIVKRPDAKELLDVRAGAWTYEEIIEYAEYMDNHIRKELYNNSSLRKTPDVKFAADLLMEVQECVWNEV